MPSSLLAVKDAIREALEADVDFTWPVLDHVPDGQPFPYVTLWEATERADLTQDGYGTEQTVTLHVFSQHKGFGEAEAIVSEMVRVLDHQILSVDGGTMWRLTYDVSWTLTEMPQAGSTGTVVIRHVPVQFRVGVRT